MNYTYKRIGHRYRPIIPIDIQYKRGVVRQEVLIDSGADLCIFRGEIGDILGIDVRDGERVEFGGIAGDKQVGYVHSVGLSVGNITRNIQVVFSYDVSDYGYGIVGQVGFFDNFRVTFDYQSHSIVLRAK